MMPSSPMLGQRSGTSSPKMGYDLVKDQVLGELASRIGRPIPEFNKNKRGSSGECELAIVLSPPTVKRNIPDNAKDEHEGYEVRPIQLKPLLQPQSASAPCSPRLGLRRPQQQITITSSATLKVTNRGATPPKTTPATTSSRDRSKSPAVHRLAAPSPGSLLATAAAGSSSSRSSSSNPSARRSRPSPSPTRRSRPTTPAAGHTSVKMSTTKRKSPARTGLAPPQFNRSISGPDPRNKTQYNRSKSANDDRLNDPEVQAKIGNRMTKTVDKTIGKCGVCVKPVTVEGCTAFGKVYHKECFKCGNCRRRIDGKFFQRNDKPYCEKCYAKVVDECCVCKQPIKGDCIEAGKKSYHPGCMRCFVCSEPLRGQYFTYEGEPICELHYKARAEKCHDCGEAIIGTCYTLDDKNFCEEHYRAKCSKCPRCDEQITGHMVRTNSAAFHPECFTCVVCTKDLSHDQFISDEQQRIFCADCHAKKKAYRCTTCRRPIVPKEGQTKAPRLRALGKDYHPDCFKCEDCGLLLDTRVKGRECYPHKDHILCLKCNRKKLSSDEESGSEDD